MAMVFCMCQLLKICEIRITSFLCNGCIMQLNRKVKINKLNFWGSIRTGVSAYYDTLFKRCKAVLARLGGVFHWAQLIESWESQTHCDNLFFKNTKINPTLKKRYTWTTQNVDPIIQEYYNMCYGTSTDMRARLKNTKLAALLGFTK
jgi:hypothetical protein